MTCTGFSPENFIEDVSGKNAIFNKLSQLSCKRESNRGFSNSRSNNGLGLLDSNQIFQRAGQWQFSHQSRSQSFAKSEVGT